MSYAAPLPRREAVLRQLRQEIVSGELPAGTVIKDAEVAARLGVSITPIREAIAQLAAEGLIDLAPNRPRRVTRVTQKNALEVAGREVRLSNPAKVYFPKPGWTKLDVAEYYIAQADAVLVHVRERPGT